MHKRGKNGKVIATVDCETDPFVFGRVPKPFLWDVFDGTRHYEFEHTSDCVAFLSTKEWIVYAHNGGKFDYHMPGFLDELQEGEEVMVINGRLAKFTIGDCEFRDSVNILPIALKDFCKLEIDYAKLEADVRHLHMEEIRKYLRVDTESLYTLVTQFRGEYGDSLTLAGAAMKFWSNRTGVKPPQSSKGFYEKIKPHYYGGRVEVFKSGVLEGPIYVYDINSAYPYAMLQEHPISTESTLLCPKVGAEIIPQSLYTVRGVSRGAFAYRDKHTLRFPSDDHIREYCTTGWELRQALESGSFESHSILSRIDFESTINFQKYVHYFYDKKRAAAEKEGKSSPAYIFAKLFMNSLTLRKVRRMSGSLLQSLPCTKGRSTTMEMRFMQRRGKGLSNLLRQRTQRIVARGGYRKMGSDAIGVES